MFEASYVKVDAEPESNSRALWLHRRDAGSKQIIIMVTAYSQLSLCVVVDNQASQYNYALVDRHGAEFIGAEEQMNDESAACCSCLQQQDQRIV